MPILKFNKWKTLVKQEMQEEFHKMKRTETKEQFELSKQRYDAFDKIAYPGGHINRNTMVSVGASIAMMLLTLHYEKLDIITSKCWNWVRPPKND